MNGQKKTILIVEDDLTHQRLVTYSLKDQYNTFIADSYDSALSILNKESINMILLDIKLNGSKSGFDLACFLRTRPEWKTIPIIAVTAYAMPEDRSRCLESGCDYYLSKPVKRQTLLTTINRLIR